VAFLHLDLRAEYTLLPECSFHGDQDVCDCGDAIDSVVYLVALTGPHAWDDDVEVVWSVFVKVKQMWEVVAEAEDRRRLSALKSR
jgi:hypothetical protein